MAEWRRVRLGGDLRDDEAFRVMGLNRTDGRALDALTDGPLTVTELSERCGMSQNATTTVVDRLAARGYVERRRDAGDRRRVAVHRTSLADQVRQQVFGPVEAWGREALSEYDDEQLSVLIRFMRQTGATQARHLELLRGMDPDAVRAPAEGAGPQA